MIAEVLPMTETIEAVATAPDDCPEHLLRSAERAAIDAHRVAAAIYTARARFLAEEAHNSLRGTREAGERAIGAHWQQEEAATSARNRAWFAAKYAREALACVRASAKLAAERAQLEARWSVGAGE